MATSAEISHESLSRAVSGQSVMNYTAIFDGFMSRGIPEDEIRPRENVFTFWAWKALGRRVKKGEHGIKATTFVPVAGRKDAASPNGDRAPGYRMPRTVTVFHISQTEVEQADAK